MGRRPGLSSWDAMQGSALAMLRSSRSGQVSSVRTSRGHLPREAVGCSPGPIASTSIWVCCAMCLPTPPGWEYLVVAVPWCPSHSAPARNRCSVLWHSTVLLSAVTSLVLPALSICPVGCNSLFMRRSSLRPSLSSAASRVAWLMISESSIVLAALCSGSLKGNPAVVGGAGGAVVSPAPCPVPPSASVSRPRPGEAGLL